MNWASWFFQSQEEADGADPAASKDAAGAAGAAENGPGLSVVIPSVADRNRDNDDAAPPSIDPGEAVDTPRVDNRAPEVVEGASSPAGAEGPRPAPIKLYKGSRFKGFLTLTLASAIHYNAAEKCARTSAGAVPCSDVQRRYSLAVSLLSLIVSSTITFGHLDPCPTTQRLLWHKFFGKPRGKVELLLIVFLVIWWSIAVGIETTVQGIAGDGKQQYSLYYSVWTCCLVCYYWILEPYLIDAGWSSSQSFIASWPFRAPAWIYIMISSLATFILYMDLWKNHPETGSQDNAESNQATTLFDSIPKSQWDWLITAALFTFFPAAGFVIVELFRDVHDDGKSAKPKIETMIEGAIFAILCVAWIPTVIVATTPGGAASLTGNAYFFTWLLVVFLFEGLIWWIHDYRLEIHHELHKQAMEYRKKQRQILEKTLQLKQERLAQARGARDNDDDSSQSSKAVDVSEPDRKVAT